MGRPPQKTNINNIEQFKLDYPNRLLTEEMLEERYKHNFYFLNREAKKMGLVRSKEKTGVNYVAGNLPMDVIIDYLDGDSCRDLAKKHNCSFPTISSFLKEHGIRVKGNVETIRQYTLQEDYFENIDTSEKAYFLGFICADGYITKKEQSVCITLHEDDVEVLENFKKAVGYSGPIFDRLMRLTDTDEWINRKSLIITNKEFVSNLVKLGVINCKSLVLEWPEISERLNGAMLLGMSDGDGSVYYNESIGVWYWNLIGTLDVVQTAKSKLMSVGLGDNKIYQYPNGVSFSICYGGYANLKKIYDYIYKDHGYCLLRKKNKFLKCFEEHGNNPLDPELNPC